MPTCTVLHLLCVNNKKMLVVLNRHNVHLLGGEGVEHMCRQRQKHQEKENRQTDRQTEISSRVNSRLPAMLTQSSYYIVNDCKNKIYFLMVVVMMVVVMVVVVMVVVVMVVVVVALSSLSRILGECSTIHSPPALFIYLFIWSGG